MTLPAIQLREHYFICSAGRDSTLFAKNLRTEVSELATGRL